MHISSGLDGKGLESTLRRLYPKYELVRLGGHVHPITVIPAEGDDCGNLEAALGDLTGDQAFEEDFYAPDWDCAGRAALVREAANAATSGGWNGPTYAFQRIRQTGDGTRIDAGPGRYRQTMVTADSLDDELCEVLESDPGGTVPLSALPRRRWITERVDDPVMNGGHRSAAVSVSCAVVARRRGGGFDVILSPRSSGVRRHVYWNHVAPAGLLQPPRCRDEQWNNWFCIRGNLLREYVEELYSIDKETLDAETAGDLEQVPEIHRLLELVADGAAHLSYTGVSVNLMMLRPEVCTTLLIDDEDWLHREHARTADTQRPFTLSGEYLTTAEAHRLPAGRKHLSRLTLDDDLRPVGEGQELRPSVLVPQAAAAIDLATRLIRQKR